MKEVKKLADEKKEIQEATIKSKELKKSKGTIGSGDVETGNGKNGDNGGNDE